MTVESVEMGMEKKPMMRQQKFTRTLAFSIFAAAFGSSFLFGYNLGVINAPQTVIGLWIRDTTCIANGGVPSQKDGQTDDIWCKKLDPTGQATMFSDNGTLNLIWALITAIFCAGGLIGALSTSFFISRYGPRMTMIINNAVGLIAVVLLSIPQAVGSYEVLIVARFVVGVSSGVNSGTPAVYFSEIAPAHLKGALGSVHQLTVTIAISISQVLGLPYIMGNSSLWPYLFAVSAVPSIVQLLTLPFCPESPKWLFLGKEDEEAARAALVRLRGTTDVEDEMSEMRAEHKVAKALPKVGVKDLFTDPFLRSITFIAIMLMVCQQMSGINAVMFYSTQIFRSAGLDAQSALYATIGMGVVNIGMTVVSVFLVEKAGRRTLLLIGYAGMLVTCVLLSCSMLIFDSGVAPVWNPAAVNPFGFFAYFSIVFVIVYVIMFATGPGSIPWFLVSELFTQGPRAAANSIAVGTNWLCSLIIAIAFPFVQTAIEEYTFLVFAGLLVIFVVYTRLRVVETKGKTQDEVQAELRQRFEQ
ncbi:solute carrier family 2, facilitated glucose transporter member 1-like [Paramacrobiotus metropolitanus]|uniref:solute carrier family 2, facilitated glucose transporter member 1-like n=1 Tax=Paramacrobiotus metropolitanus TaxID=2943436 RepID=UPI002445EFE6|nr:solute carrier family 2, facilitated glucose transporter member 1-like [Paramacrobiotus metropolitanus]